MKTMNRFFGSGIALRPGDVPRYVEVPGSRKKLECDSEKRSANMKRPELTLKHFAAMMLALAPGWALAFSSGSTGADGPFSPTVNTVVTLPPSGIFNYTTVNIPAGVTVTYLKNTTNTSVVILATGDVTIAGSLNVRGNSSPNVGAAGDGNQGDDGQPGKGGPGGFDGGKGGNDLGGAPLLVSFFAGTGLGPGGGGGGASWLTSTNCDCRGCSTSGFSKSEPGAGGGFGAAAGAAGDASCVLGSVNYVQPQGGPSYGSTLLLPLIGGSGGGGGGGGSTFAGSGGGGGGGAILIASSGTVSVTGSVLADGGASGSTAGGGCGSTGGGGSGGAIRIIATTIAGNGTISAAGGGAGGIGTCGSVDRVVQGSAGAPGRVRLEAETITRTAASNPVATSDLPGNVFVAGFPTLTISSVAGVPAPSTPTGTADITLPAGTPNPVTVVFTTSNVPVGNTVLLKVIPQTGATSSAISPALTGSTASATASVSVNLPVGPSVLQAQTTFTIVAALGDLLKNFAGNERVEKITLSATLGGKSRMTLITVSGHEYEAPEAAIRIAAMGG
jgi:hypothetical protein